MLFAFELSGEHETLPKAEALACLASLNIEYEQKMSLDQLLVVETKSNDLDLGKISERLAMTHSISEVLGTCRAEKEKIHGMVSTIDLLGKEFSFAVRVKGSDQSKFSSTEMEREIGRLIHDRGYKVDLSSPEKIFRVIIVSGLCFFCVLLSRVDRTQFEMRRPHLRPFFHPGVLLPRVARAIVNLSQIRSGDTLLDPFCGTGGILIEAGYIGAKIIGCDIQEKMVIGARENLEYYGFSPSLLVGDASRIAIMENGVNAVVSDLPYGRSVSLKGLEIKTSLEEMYRVLKNGSRAVIVSNSQLEEKMKKTCFKIVGQHAYMVHKSLTRHITVLIKS
jgi:tRNA (guanine10-N2)-dimethyltransferase